jgi:dihydroorotase
MIDPHVHCRDWNQKHKETIEHALYVAEKAGLSRISDMPNPDPAITSEETVEKRLADAEKIKSKVDYSLYIGLTSVENQIIGAVNCWKKYFPKVVGLKMYAGKSVGNLAIIDEEKQRFVYKTLAKYNYGGVLAVHCEKESLLKPELFNPNNPRTWSFARPPESEIESIKDQIKFAEEAEFEGDLHICHVSVPDSVDIINSTKYVVISCGVTPHHCMLNYEMIPESKEGLIYKVNPPLRSREHSEKLFSLLKKGKIDFIETDHAPHTLKEKLEDKMSGFPGMPFYPHFIKYLEKDGFSSEQIYNLTHKNICNIFNIDVPLRKNIKPDFNLHKEYEVDVYKGLRK